MPQMPLQQTQRPRTDRKASEEHKTSESQERRNHININLFRPLNGIFFICIGSYFECQDLLVDSRTTAYSCGVPCYNIIAATQFKERMQARMPYPCKSGWVDKQFITWLRGAPLLDSQSAPPTLLRFVLTKLTSQTHENSFNKGSGATDFNKGA